MIKVKISILWHFSYDFRSCIQISNQSHSRIIKKTLDCNFQLFLGHSRLFSMKKWGVPNAPFFILIFCHISDYKWKCFGGKTSRFSKKLPKTILNSCENFYGRGFNHFCATPIWNSVPRHMTHPVGHKSDWKSVSGVF